MRAYILSCDARNTGALAAQAGNVDGAAIDLARGVGHVGHKGQVLVGHGLHAAQTRRCDSIIDKGSDEVCGDGTWCQHTVAAIDLGAGVERKREVLFAACTVGRGIASSYASTPVTARVGAVAVGLVVVFWQALSSL